MNEFKLKQQVWMIKTGVTFNCTNTVSELGMAFWCEDIEEIHTRVNEYGSSMTYRLGNGEFKQECELFLSKKDAIQYVIDRLIEEQNRE